MGYGVRVFVPSFIHRVYQRCPPLSRSGSGIHRCVPFTCPPPPLLDALLVI